MSFICAQDNERASKTNFHMNGCAPALVFEAEEKGNSEMAYLKSMPE